MPPVSVPVAVKATARGAVPEVGLPEAVTVGSAAAVTVMATEAVAVLELASVTVTVAV